MRKGREAWEKVGMEEETGGYTNFLEFGVVCRKDAGWRICMHDTARGP